MHTHSNTIIRTIWCDDCNAPRRHTIMLATSFQDGQEYHIIFHSTCLYCLDHKFKSKIQQCEIISKDWNSLVTKELYNIKDIRQ